MMRSKIFFPVIFITASQLNGCSMIQDWLPDKEKDYQFTTELPPLMIPADLAQKPKVSPKIAAAEIAAPKVEKAIEHVKTQLAAHAPEIAAVETAVNVEIEKTAVSRPSLNLAETPLGKNEIQISLTRENAPTLNLNVPTARAWRIVGKALSRSGIEVTKHDVQAGQITVQVAEKTEKATPEEDSFFGSASSVFTGFIGNEQRYILQFQEVSEKTAVTVLDSELQLLKNAESEKLLSTLFDAIKRDLSQ